MALRWLRCPLQTVSGGDFPCPLHQGLVIGPTVSRQRLIDVHQVGIVYLENASDPPPGTAAQVEAVHQDTLYPHPFEFREKSVDLLLAVGEEGQERTAEGPG